MRPVPSAAPPAGPRALARALAPASRGLRDALARALESPDPGLRALVGAWRRALPGGDDDRHLADACAQLVTLALLLARLDPDAALPDPLALARAAAATPPGPLAAPLARLARTIAALDLDAVGAADGAFWRDYYEHFLAAYDPDLRREAGAYYTPDEVVSAQLALTSQLLARELDRPLGFAGPDVHTLDPACGTGTYYHQLLARTLAQLRISAPPRDLAAHATHLAANLTAFELMPGPAAVAHLRLTDALVRAGALLPPGGARVHVRDTLAAPDAHAPEGGVLVCLGNPPYDRQTVAGADRTLRRGGWIRHGHPTAAARPLLADFLPAPGDPAGRHAKNLYNDYVYFWRWALWRVFERRSGPGIVCFVTPASFLRGPGFVAMRRHMRALADDLWIVDLGGDTRGPAASANVFPVATPVCITLALRRGDSSRGQPAHIHYSCLSDDLDRPGKLARLRAVRSFADLAWQPGPDAWEAAFVPTAAGDVARWPRLDRLLPWHHSGAQWKRTWPVAPTEELLQRRWRALLAADDRRALFRESEAWTVDRAGADLRDETTLAPIRTLDRAAPPPPIVRYAWRAFDRQWCLADGRLGDRLRPVLWQVHGERQIYLTTLMSTHLSRGPAVVACAHVPDLHHFRGSFGDRGVFPVWRDAAAREPNLSAGLLAALQDRLACPISPEDLFAYIYGCLANPALTALLAGARAGPGPRVPITAERPLFTRMTALGRSLLHLHTRGERLPGEAPLAGAARCLSPVSPDIYPQSFRHDQDTLHVGDGRLAPVPREVWRYEVSGLMVVRAWLAARMASPRGRRSSPLDALRPQRWTDAMTRELLELLWVLERSLALHRQQAEVLRTIVAGPLIPEGALPQPAPGQDRPPARAH